MRRSLKKRSAFRMSTQPRMPKIWTSTAAAPDAPTLPVVSEAERHAEVARAEEVDHRLEGILRRADHPQLVPMDLHLHLLELLVADLPGDLLGRLLVDPELEPDALPRAPSS